MRDWGDVIWGGTGSTSIIGSVSVDADSSYKVSGIDAASDPIYIGFQNSTGGWYIQQVNIATMEILYIKGTTGFAAAWTGRTILSYDTAENTF